jgi:hypothetical protein
MVGTVTSIAAWPERRGGDTTGEGQCRERRRCGPERHAVGGNTARVGRSASDTLGFMVSLGPNS